MARALFDRVCRECESDFHAKTGNARYCSYACAFAFDKRRRANSHATRVVERPIDPWLLVQSGKASAATKKQYDRLQARIIHERIADEDLLPLTQFMGHGGLSRQRSMWNILQLMYVWEMPSP